MTIDGLLTRFLENAVVKESTSTAFRQTTDSLREHFGGAASIATLGAAQADGWRKALTEPVGRGRSRSAGSRRLVLSQVCANSSAIAAPLSAKLKRNHYTKNHRAQAEVFLPAWRE